MSIVQAICRNYGIVITTCMLFSDTYMLYFVECLPKPPSYKEGGFFFAARYSAEPSARIGTAGAYAACRAVSASGWKILRPESSGFCTGFPGRKAGLLYWRDQT